MRDCPMRVISCSSFTESSSFSSNAMMRRRVGSARARSDFRVDDMIDLAKYLLTGFAKVISSYPDTSICQCDSNPRFDSAMSKNYIFSSESVGEGHPDKVCDTISDAVLDACIAQDKYSRVACETYAKSNLVVVGGEITTKAVLDYNAVARQAIRDIGYAHDDDVFHADRVLIVNAITQQSPDIALGVDAREAEGKGHREQGAGDQGLMFGYACNETPELMPAPIMYAHQIGRELTRIRKGGRVKWLRPDAKSQVSVEYIDDQPVRITNVVVSTQHSHDVKHKEIKDFIIKEVIKKV